MDTLERVCEIVADVTLNSPRQVNENSSADDLDGWDSAAQVSIIAAIEMDFGVSFPDEQTESLNSIRKIIHALRIREIAA